MFLSLKTLYRKRTVIWPFYFYTIIRTLSLVALIFIILSLINDVKSINSDYEIIILEIINTYKINKSTDDFGNNISLNDFKFSLFWICIMIITLIIFILIN